MKTRIKIINISEINQLNYISNKILSNTRVNIFDIKITTIRMYLLIN